MSDWKCPKCGETASGPGAKDVAERHERKKHGKPARK